MSILFGPIRQMGYVVQDIEAAMQHWTRALSYSGNMQIALVAIEKI
jgi:hypothetical protein